MCRFTLSWSWKVRLLRHQKARPPRHRCWRLHQPFAILPSCITSRHAGIWMRQILREVDTEPVFLLLGHCSWKSHLEKPQSVEHKLQYPTNSSCPKWRWYMYRDRCQWTTPGQRSWAWSGELLDLSLTRYATAPILNGSDRSRVQEAC